MTADPRKPRGHQGLQAEAAAPRKLASAPLEAEAAERIAALLLTMALVSYHLISTPLASGIWVAAAIYLLLRCLLFRVAPALLLAAATGIWLFWP